MGTEIFYRQCVLVRGKTQTTSWIPEKFAQKGRPVALRRDGKWDDGWVVESAGARTSSEEMRFISVRGSDLVTKR